MHDALADLNRPLAEALMLFYEGQLSIYFSGEGHPRGCFAIGTATTEAVEDVEIREALSALISKLDVDLEIRLRAAVHTGELPDDVDPVALAALAAAMLYSIAIRARAGKSRAELTQLARHAVSVICG
jgi:hypothetical protein